VLSGAYEELMKLQSFCNDKFPEGPPSFAGFIKVVKAHAENNKPREESAESPADSGPSASAGPAAPAEIASLDDAFMAIQKAAYYLLEQGRSNPLAYRLNRILKWGNISGDLPNDGGRTLFPAPNPHVLEGLKEMAAGQRWSDLMGVGEENFSSDSGMLWMDLQRYLCQALQAQGGDFAACAKAIRIELAMLLQRSPGLPELTFEDGTPFADAMTKEWIQTEVMSSLGGGGGGMAMAAIKKKGDVGEEQKAAEALLSEGKLDQALHALRTGLANDSSEKNNFDRKLIMAELCYKGSKPNIAKAIQEDLIAEMERQDLVKWDPELCVSVYHLAQKTYLSLFEQSDDYARPALREKALAMHTQISKLNPVLAISADFK
jgi:type VI secretion system protein VasJ